MTGDQDAERTEQANLIVTLPLGILAFGAAYGLYLLDPLWFFGGTSCNTVNGVYGCSGYLPVGLMIAVVGAVFVVVPIVQQLFRGVTAVAR